jgi:hypothetical protein
MKQNGTEFNDNNQLKLISNILSLAISMQLNAALINIKVIKSNLSQQLNQWYNVNASSNKHGEYATYHIKALKNYLAACESCNCSNQG